MKAVIASVAVVGCAGSPSPAPPSQVLPAAIVAVEDACGPTELASNATNLFWIASCDGSIRTLAKLDGTVQTIAREPTAAMLAADNDFVYWTENRSIFKAPR